MKCVTGVFGYGSLWKAYMPTCLYCMQLLHSVFSVFFGLPATQLHIYCSALQLFMDDLSRRFRFPCRHRRGRGRFRQGLFFHHDRRLGLYFDSARRFTLGRSGRCGRSRL